MGDVFSASTGHIHRAAQIFAEIRDITDHAVGDFDAACRASSGWVGRDDSMARELGPRDQKERQGTTDTGTSLMDAVAGMARALNVNGNLIQGAQNDAFEAIDDQASRNGRH